MKVINKYFKIYQSHPNLISVNLIENNEIVGGYIIPNTKETIKFIKEHCEKEGYIENKNK